MAEVKKQARRTRKTKEEAAPEVASSTSTAAKPEVEKEAKPEVTKLKNGLVIVSR